MEKEQVIEKLNNLKKERGVISRIERGVKMPLNCLSRYIKDPSKMPEKWVKAIAEYLDEKPKSIPYLTVEMDGQLIKMKALGIEQNGCTFEQMINTVIFMAGEAIGKNKILEAELDLAKKIQPSQQKVQVTNLTAEPPKTNYTINTEQPPVFKNYIEQLVWETEQKLKNKNK